MDRDQLIADIAAIYQQMAVVAEQQDADMSREHCALQCRYWRLQCALAALEYTSDNDKTRVKASSFLLKASAEAERWEKRRQEALRVEYTKYLPMVLARLDERDQQRALLAELD
jgi:hypothetical protein